MSRDQLCLALLAALDVVARPGTVLTADLPLDQTTVDSIGLLEAMVHLEELIDVELTEEDVRQLALEPAYAATMTISELASLIHDVVGRGGTAGS